MDFDTRDNDSHDEDRFNTHGSKGGARDDFDGDDELRLPDAGSRDRE